MIKILSIRIFIIFIFLSSTIGLCFGEEVVDVSLFLRRDSLYTNQIVFQNANLFNKIGHHGPAIENEFLALRLYFNNSGSIDAYNKSKKQLELKQTKWYTSDELLLQGFGCDQYVVGKTVGLGGIKLWTGDSIVDLIATKGREAKVYKTQNSATMELLAKGVEYKNELVDILISVTVESNNRMATVVAECISGQNVQFVTGINFNKDNIVINDNGYVIVWGKHPSDVISNPSEIGSSFVYDNSLFERNFKSDNQVSFISYPLKKIHSWITSVSDGDPELFKFNLFKEFIISEYNKLNF